MSYLYAGAPGSILDSETAQSRLLSSYLISQHPLFRLNEIKFRSALK